MSYATLMVHLELGRSNAALLNVAADLAERSQAGVIGIAACQPLMATAFAGAYVSGEAIELDRVEIESEAKEAQAEFRALLDGRVADIEWRCVVARRSGRESATIKMRIRCVGTGVGRSP